MRNNDVLRRVRYIFDFNDEKMVLLFDQGDCTVTRDQVCQWLKSDEDPAFESCDDLAFGSFLNGLIFELRGKKDGAQVAPQKVLTNNSIFMKLKIALSLQAEDVLAILDLADFRMSKHELSAFFRKPTHKHYRECKDQILRNFLMGLQLKVRGKPNEETVEIKE